eukprot:2097109-Ditylum_brightwellii.AAC.1
MKKVALSKYFIQLSWYFISQDKSLVKHFKDTKTKCGVNFRLYGDLNDFKMHMSSELTGEMHGK